MVKWGLELFIALRVSKCYFRLFVSVDHEDSNQSEESSGLRSDIGKGLADQNCTTSEALSRDASSNACKDVVSTIPRNYRGTSQDVRIWWVCKTTESTVFRVL